MHVTSITAHVIWEAAYSTRGVATEGLVQPPPPPYTHTSLQDQVCNSSKSDEKMFGGRGGGVKVKKLRPKSSIVTIVTHVTICCGFSIVLRN